MGTSTTQPKLELHDKFQATFKSVNTRVIERHHVVRSLFLALIGRVNVLLLGPPGCAKTMAVNQLVAHIRDLPADGYFWKPLNKGTLPPEIIGPPDIKAMAEEGKYRHVTANMIVPALIRFLDEVFRGSSATRDLLLTMICEGFFLDGGEKIFVPGWFFIGASNSGPNGEEDLAFYDRLDLRHKVEYLTESASFISMLRGSRLGAPTDLLTVNDIETAQALCAAVTIPTEIEDALLKLRSELNRKGIRPSDRKFETSLNVIGASAVLRGATEAEISDMIDLRHMLWDDPEDRVEVDKHVLQLASPLDAKVLEVRDGIDELGDEFDKIFRDNEFDNPTERNQKAVELHRQLEDATDELADIEKKFDRPSTLLDEQFSRVEAMADRIIRDVFRYDPEDGTRRRKRKAA